MSRLRDSLINYFTLFGSMGTLVCCALPAFLVSLGLGAVMAGLAANVPGLVWMSEHKPGVFGFAGGMLALNGFMIWKHRNAPCPLDPKLREACISGRKFSQNIYFLSIAVFVTGFFFAFVAPNIF
jgi:hypothetical protein